MANESRTAILASIAANIAIAITKFTVAGLSKSMAMFAEGVHSLVNCSDGTLLLLGTHRAKKPPDAAHPFGHGREVYFWSLIVAVVFFALGSGVTIAEGVVSLMHLRELGDPTWNYVVLAFSAVFDGASFLIGLRQFRKRLRPRGYWATIRESKDPTLFSVVLEDVADLLGLAIAFLGVLLSHLLNTPVFDAMASIAIGCVIGAIAIVLLTETHGLLIGEAARPELLLAVKSAVTENPDVSAVGEPQSIHIAPDHVVIALRVRPEPGLSADRFTASAKSLSRRVREEHVEVKQVLFDVSADESSGTA
jgi:cation diffusion facilitator family transporter